jgi:four helix bundle protein
VTVDGRGTTGTGRGRGRGWGWGWGVELRPLVERIRKRDNTLAKQLVDAMNSTVQNLAEGERHTGGNKRLEYEIAHGEANEVKGSLDLALAWGHIADDTAARAKLSRLLALCWGLTHPKQRAR